MPSLSKEPFKNQIVRFPAKVRGPEQDAARVRNNQRRHRAKTKSRINELEASLEATQNQLEVALRQIEGLTVEIQQLRTELQSQNGHASPKRAISGPSTIQMARRPALPGVGVCDCASIESQLQASHLSPGRLATGLGTSSTNMVLNESLSSLGATDNTTGEVSVDDDCPNLPAPRQDESTIPCRDAYAILAEQAGVVEVDPETAREWLQPGFRRAVVPGTGCRIQTHVLFAFVDHITP